MPTIKKQLQPIDIEKIARDGTRIYEAVKTQYEPQYLGKYLAIEIESKSIYMGDDGVEVMDQAREYHPEKVFFVMRVGYDAAERVFKSFLERAHLKL